MNQAVFCVTPFLLLTIIQTVASHFRRVWTVLILGAEKDYGMKRQYTRR